MKKVSGAKFFDHESYFPKISSCEILGSGLFPIRQDVQWQNLCTLDMCNESSATHGMGILN
jgi:hypothetical protein